MDNNHHLLITNYIFANNSPKFYGFFDKIKMYFLIDKNNVF